MIPTDSFHPLGNRVLLLRLEEEEIVNSSGLVIPDTWKHGSVVHKVLSVGPGGWVWNVKKKKRRWETPQVMPGDVVISTHFFSASEHPNWKEPVYLDYADGRGRVLVDSRFIQCKCSTQN
jgi:co-chaperonin GroES (HSP10)